ncbi:MAG TPA: hypothetical protein VJ841_04260 [Candidatus Saccharimonadales bacterium]|nr:hypothetical protein [Candidatus Saccharimonadales bacterium]
MNRDAAFTRTVEILYADEAFDLGTEPSLVGGYVFAAALCTDEDQLFVTEQHFLKWGFEVLAQCAGLHVKNVKKSLFNAHMYSYNSKDKRLVGSRVDVMVRERPSSHLNDLRGKLATLVRTRDVPINYPVVGLREKLRAEERAVFRQALLLPLDNRRVLAKVAAKKENPPRGFQEGLCETILGWHQDRRQQLVKLLV